MRRYILFNKIVNNLGACILVATVVVFSFFLGGYAVWD